MKWLAQESDNITSLWKNSFMVLLIIFFPLMAFFFGIIILAKIISELIKDYNKTSK